MSETDPIRVTRLEVKDILGVREVDLILPPDEAVHIIGGPNGGAKSSALTALLIAMADAGGHPSEALRRGASKGAVRVTFDDGMTVTRRIRRGKAPQLEVVDSNGKPMGVGSGGPQRGVLDKLLGKFTWDPTEALRLPAPELRQVLMRLAGVDWAALDKEAAEIRTERTAVNRDVTRSRITLDAMPPHDDAPAKHVDTAALVAEQRKVREHNTAHEANQERLADTAERIAGYRAEIEEVNEEIQRLQGKLSELRGCLKRGLVAERQDRLAVENHEPLPRTEDQIERELASAAEINAKVDGRARYQAQARELRQHEAESKAHTTRLAEIEAEKQQQLEAAEFPIPGLSVSDDGVLYNGLPFEQAEESARLRVSVAIGIALNPRMPTMICRYGGGLDEQGIELLKQIVAEGKGQLLLEHPWVPPEKCRAYISEGRQK